LEAGCCSKGRPVLPFRNLGCWVGLNIRRGTLQSHIGIGLLVEVWLHIIPLLICHILLSIHIPARIISWLTHLRGINHHGVHRLRQHNIRLSSPAQEAHDNKKDDGKDDGGNDIVDPGVVVVEVVAVV
jgi:hypothetical protein